jgi:hypothetical protein
MSTKMSAIALVCCFVFSCSTSDPANVPGDAGTDASIVTISNPTSDGASDRQITVTCTESPKASTYSDASNSGCQSSTPVQLCDVSAGATILPDGGVSGGTVSCQSGCLSSEYSVTCLSSDGGNPLSPDASLGCRDMGVPTPPYASFSCCPCL